MKYADILRQALQNLRRRKSRTILTSIGVMIGCTSILVMVSIGNGMSESMKASLANMGSLNDITIYNYPNYGSNGQMLSTDKVLDETIIDQIRAIPHVKAASGQLTLDNLMTEASVKNGRYMADWMNVMAMDRSMLEELGLEVLEGDLDLESTSTQTIPVIVGQYLAYNFRDTMRPEGYNRIDRYASMSYDPSMTQEEIEASLPDPYFDIMKEDISLSVRADYENEAAARFKLKPVARVREDYNVGWQTSEGCIMNLASLQRIITQAYREAGKPAPSARYETALVRVDDISNVEEVENTIKELGFDTSSMESIRKNMEEQALTAQLMLGGLGAIALVVAAIGITNTMVMSISERTREIGIMKALGCRTGDIRQIFLTEAGLIGLVGGVLGVILSYAISAGINYYAWQSMGQAEPFWEFLTGSAQRISVMPLWLVAFGVLFSMGVGLLSGYMPARKAVRIPALDAIRRE